MEFADNTKFIDLWFAQFLGLGAQSVLNAIVILAVFAVLAWLADDILHEIIPRFIAKTQTTLNDELLKANDELLKALQRPVKRLIILTGLALAIRSLEFRTLFEPFDTIVTILYILLGAYLVSNIIHSLIQWYSNDIAHKTKSKFDDQLIPFLGKVDRIAIFTVALLMILYRLEYDMHIILFAIPLVIVAYLIILAKRYVDAKVQESNASTNLNALKESIEKIEMKLDKIESILSTRK